MQAAVRLCQRQLVGAAQQHGGGAPALLDAGDLHHLAALAQLQQQEGQDRGGTRGRRQLLS